MTRYIVMTAAAKMPSTVRSPYRRVAVLEVDLPKGVAYPKMISDRAAGVVRVVRTWERLNVGLTARSAYAKALIEAEALAARLNKVGEVISTLKAAVDDDPYGMFEERRRHP
jgi:hypothetical protein